MDEIPGVPPGENFFDDGDDHILGRIDEGEAADAYGLVELSDEEVEQTLARGEQARAEAANAGPNAADEYDWRMDGRGQPPKAPRGLHPKSQNTGPKGVKKDFEIAKKNNQIARDFAAMRRDRAVRQLSQQVSAFHISSDATPSDSSASNKAIIDAAVRARAKEGDDFRARPMSSSAADDLRNRRIEALRRAQQEQQQQDKGQQQKKPSAGSDSDSGLDSDEEQAFQAYKAARLREVQASLPTFGSYVRAQRFHELADALKNTHELTPTVVHIYENDVQACLSLHLTFEAMAPQFPHVCFLRIRSSEAMGGGSGGKGYDPRGLPTLLIYRGNELKDSIIAVAAQLGTTTPSDAAVAKLLASKGVLTVPTGGLGEVTRARRDVWDERHEDGGKGCTVRMGGPTGAVAAGAGAAGVRVGGVGRVAAAALDSDDDDDDDDDDD